jgi:hypothetical protein
MFFAEVLDFWLLVGAAFFGLRRLANGKESRVLPVTPRSSGWRT